MREWLSSIWKKEGERTMEEPDTGVVGYDTEGDTFTGGDLDGVTTDGVRQALVDRRVERRVIRGVVSRALDDLELVSVQMAIGR